MATVKWTKFWLTAAIILLIIIIIGGVVVWTRYPRNSAIEIILPQPEKLQGEVYVGGAVKVPGIYSLKADDTLASLIRVAGGATAGADTSVLQLRVSIKDDKNLPQRVDINRAESWLLQALPEIGASRAKTIVDYRNQHGLFRNTSELTKVEGISTTTYERIKNMITVGD